MDGVTTGGFVGGFGAQVPVVSGSTAKAARDVAAENRAQWSYEEAFKRNRGLITEVEQEKLRNSRVAIAGMGGVGGVHLITLARLGIGKFTIADPDVFEVANFNRQYGATISNLGRNKAEAMAEAALDINPELELRVFASAVDEANIDAFLKDVDLVVDGLDFFAIEARRMLFQQAVERGIWAVTAGPIGFSTAWLAFDPKGMTFDRYFDLSDSMERIDMLAAFAVGLTPKALQMPYTDLSYASIEDRTGPSTSIGCQLAAGVMGSESLKLLLKRGEVATAPEFLQFDAYRKRFVRRRLRWGNRSPWQRLKRVALARRFAPDSGTVRSQGFLERAKETIRSVPPIHRYVPLIIGQALSKQTLERRPEPRAVTDQLDNVLQYDQVMTTKLAIVYAICLEMIYKTRQEPFGGSAIDLACGPGHFSLCMAKHLKLDSLTGIDLSRPMVDVARKNANEQELPNCAFRVGDITKLHDIPDASYDLCTFTDAAHHMPDLETVGKVIAEMDRITKPDGLVFVADLVRLKNEKLTDKYVKLVGEDYHARGLSSFYDDFRNSMYAAWTSSELSEGFRLSHGQRRWIQVVPRELPSIQLVVGIPVGQLSLTQRSGKPWQADTQPLSKSLRNDYHCLRTSLHLAKTLEI
jgi:molybdopterin/thiamine biosynthesis adenylyltransferase/ubiquinone/menaquinone biosynthesis C-methylase UbiE